MEKSEEEVRKMPSIRVTSELDSESSSVMHKLSCKLLDGIAKLKLSIHQDSPFNPLDFTDLHFKSKHLSLHYDIHQNNALITASLDPTPRLSLRAVHDLAARQALVSCNIVPFPLNSGYSLEISSPIPTPLPLPSKASLKFPAGEVSVEDNNDDDNPANLYLNATLKANAFDGLCSAQYSGGDVNLRYAFKDDQLAFIPSISLPSNSLSLAFKRRFSPSHKLSYWYNFDANNWSAVYKQTYANDLKLKAGYDSEVRLAWASLWVGDEHGKVKAAPLKMKLQFMLQVPQDDIKSSALMFRVKKRWDI